MRFNRNPLVIRDDLGFLGQPKEKEIRQTPGLFNASLEDALMYGGTLTRAALGMMDIKGDRRYVIVDTKISMLMPGMYPAIPGWHTDGVPRLKGKDKPDIHAQEEMQSPRFHLLVTGYGCLTDFIDEPLQLQVPDEPGSNLYELLDKQIKECFKEEEEATDNPEEWIKPTTIPSCVVEWDWWNLHTATAAKNHEWRFLIRVTETDYREPKRDLRDVIRTHEQIYVPESFGW